MIGAAVARWHGLSRQMNQRLAGFREGLEKVVTKIPAGTAAFGTLIVPAVGVASAMLLLGEKPALADYVGLALIMAAAGSVLLPRGKLT